MIRPFVAAYAAEIPLLAEELALLPLLIQTRLATTITMRYWRAAIRGDSDAYALKSRATEGDAEVFLNLLRGRGADQPLL